MKWAIVADSSCDLWEAEVSCDAVSFSTVPFSILVGDHAYVDDGQLDVQKMLDDMEQSPAPSRTACPAPGAWVPLFERAENVIAITISGRLSGSLNSAHAARDMVLDRYPEKKISVIDSMATGPETALCILHMVRWIKAGLAIEEVTQKAEEFLRACKTSFALSSFNNLVKNGRMGKLSGFVARKLGMWGIGIGSDTGTIVMRGKSRGTARAVTLLLDDMEQRGFTGGEVAISHCLNERMAEELRYSILERWYTADIRVMETRGLDSFYAERSGLILAFCGSGDV